MKDRMSIVLAFVKRRKVLLSCVLAALILIALGFSLGGNGKVETVSVATQDLVRTVKISGKVVPEERVDLGFEIGGTIASADKPVGSTVYRGEVLARLDSGGIAADLLKAEAELSSAQAELNKLEGTEVYENSIPNTPRSLTQAILNAYTAASDAVLNKADRLFVNPQSKNTTPSLVGSLGGYVDLRDSVEAGRLAMGPVLDKWQDLVVGLGVSTYSQAQLDLSKKYLGQTVSFLSDVSRAVNLFEDSSYLPQSTIDEYKTIVLSAQDGLSIASKSLIDNESSLAKLLSDVPVQVARVEAAKASVLNLRFELAKARLTSPINGIVAKQDAKPGQAAISGVNLVSVISRGYLIETFVPEISIVGVKVGDVARVTLDAYGTQAFFDATVVRIDPAETVRDGVSTYKTQLAFVKPDDRIRSGMTANVEIETLRKPAASLIPDRTVFREDGEVFVYVLNKSNEEVKRTVTLGEKDSKGNVEVVSGLSSEDKIIVNPSKN